MSATSTPSKDYPEGECLIEDHFYQEQLNYPLAQEYYYIPQLYRPIDHRFNGIVIRERYFLGLPCEILSMRSEDRQRSILVAHKYPTSNGARYSIYDATQKPLKLIASLRGNKKKRTFTLSLLNPRVVSMIIKYIGKKRTKERNFTVQLPVSSVRNNTELLKAQKPNHNGYYGRAKISSIKNCLLTNKANELVFIFGKVDKTLHRCFINSPLSLVESFALCCASTNSGSFQF